ncbi:hypothetical protein Poly41_57400 [Novipirellula artificiosorum]|uniref:Uncharacterized protein n=1 Tax=Novipirellula artificiosorum TaxID=2528016 RepID=A0A5C6D840_9BACT|nr:hypothetical protein Poly41_57400 [Novipirellula artificiosorum]
MRILIALTVLSLVLVLKPTCAGELEDGFRVPPATA